MKKDSENPEVVIVGDGYSGLQAGLSLGRCMIKTVLLNGEAPRNKVTQEGHNFLTRDGTHPLKFLELGKRELEKYKEYVTYIKDVVIDVKSRNDQGRFYVKTELGQVYFPRWIIFATGYQDHIEKWNILGLKEVWGKSVWHCPFCDGYEVRGQPLALFGDEMAEHMIQVLQHFSQDLMVFTKPHVISKQAKQLCIKKNIQIIEDEIVAIDHDNGQMKSLELTTGKKIPRRYGFVSTTYDTCSDLPAKLGVEKTPIGSYKGKMMDGKTTIPGIYVAGDLKDYFTGAIVAAAQGSMAAESIAMEIMEEEFGKLETPFLFPVEDEEK